MQINGNQNHTGTKQKMTRVTQKGPYNSRNSEDPDQSDIRVIWSEISLTFRRVGILAGESESKIQIARMPSNLGLGFSQCVKMFLTEWHAPIILNKLFECVRRFI